MVSRALYNQRIQAGLCVRCGQNLDSSINKQCTDCIKSAKEQRDKLRSDRLKNGLCVICGKNETQTDSKYCEICHDKKKSVDKGIYLARSSAKVCVKCSQPSETAYCKDCYSTKVATNSSEMEVSKNTILQAYGNQCKNCEHTNADELQIVSSNPQKPLKNHGHQLFTLILQQIKDTKKLPTEYVVLCNECYRSRSIKAATPMKQNTQQLDLED